MENDLSGDDKTKERIKFNIEILRLTTIGILTIGGGIVSMAEQGDFTGKRNFFIAMGLILVVVQIRLLIGALVIISKTIKK